MRWGIVGGTAGPAAALLLARAGHEVVLFERVDNPLPVGAGILLQPTGLAVLRRLGLLQRVLARGERIERLSGHTAGGRMVLDLGYADHREGLHGLGIHRGALFAALWEAVAAEPRVEVRTGHTVEAREETPAGVVLRGLHGDEPFTSEPFDRVAIAGGARCGIRPPGARVTPYPWGALWFVAHENPRPGVLAQRYRDTRRMVGILPSGEGSVSVFWSLRADALEAWKAAGLDAWKREVAALMPEVPIHAVRTPEDVIFAPYFDVVSPTWHDGRTVWLGDAGHAMSPQLGQGPTSRCRTPPRWPTRPTWPATAAHAPIRYGSTASLRGCSRPSSSRACRSSRPLATSWPGRCMRGDGTGARWSPRWWG